MMVLTTTRILSRAIFWLVLVTLCAMAAPAPAAEPAWWTAQKKSCGLSPGLAYNSWDGVCKSSTGAAGGGSSLQNQLLLQGAGALGNAIGQSIHDSLFGSPQDEARKAQEAAEQQRLIELRRQEELQQQELAKQRILGALKGAETSGGLALKLDSEQPLLVREAPQGAFGATEIVPANSGFSSLGGLQLKLGDDAEQSSVQVSQGFDTAGKIKGAELLAPPPVPVSVATVKMEKISALKSLLQKAHDEERALNALLDKLKQSPQPDQGAINDLQKMIVVKEDDQKKAEEELLDLTAEDE